MRIYFGKDRSVELTVPPKCLILSNAPGSVADSRLALQAALDQPLGLPPLERCITPDDKIVLAVGANVPCEPQVISSLSEKLLKTGIRAENITVLLWESETEGDSENEPGGDSENKPGGDSDSELERSGEKRVSESDVAPTELEKLLPSGVVIHRHKTSDPQSYEILATMDSGDPLAFVRPIVEADIVIPVGTYEPTIVDQATDSLGVFSALYPRFSTKEVQERFQNPVLFNLIEKELPDLPDAVLENLTETAVQPMDEYAELEEMSRMRWEKIAGTPDRRPDKNKDRQPSEQDLYENRSPDYYRSRRKEEVQKSGWELGVILSMIVVPGPGDSIADVYFGLPREVEEKIEQQKALQRQQEISAQGIGKLKFQSRPKNVICGFNGAAAIQTWPRLTDLLESAAFQSANHSNIYLLADVCQKMGPGFQLLREAADLLAGNLQAVSAKLYRERFYDSVAALRWLRVLQSHRIYWLSRLPADVVEALGAIPVQNEAEMNRLLNAER